MTPAAPPTTSTPPAIEVHGLRKRFGRHEVLSAIDLTVPTNSIYGFLGPNGAGKSTTMKILVGLLHPSGGSARVAGHDIARDSLEARASIGYLPQDPKYSRHLRVHDVLEFTARQYLKLSHRQLRRHVDDTIDLTGLGALVRRRVAKLSGGERQRLGVAEAWIGQPEVLILDEPSSGLDPEGRHEVLDLLDTLREFATILYSTHILDDVERVADHIAVIDRGVIVADGSIDSFLVGETATYLVRLDGPDHGATDALQQAPWVSSVEQAPDGHVEVSVTDRSQAEHAILRHYLTNRARVLEFRPARRSLEDIYLELVTENETESEQVDAA